MSVTERRIWYGWVKKSGCVNAPTTGWSLARFPPAGTIKVAAALPPPAPAERRPWRTAADRSYADSLCADPVLLETGWRLTVIGDPAVSDTTADLTLTLRSGEKFRLTHDLVARVGVDELARGLRAKAAALLDQATADRLWAATSALDDLAARDLGELLRA